MKANVPPKPTVAVIVAADPVCPDSVTAIDTVPLYPDPKLPLNPVVVPIPTETIDPPAPTIAVTDAPTRGAYPRPGVDPRETIIPPLGNWLIFTSSLEIKTDPFEEVIPVKTILLIPTDISSTIL